MLGSIIIPQVLAGARLASQSPEILFGGRAKKHRTMFTILAFISFPFHPIILELQEEYINLKLKNDESNRLLLQKRFAIRYSLRSFKKLELCLETIFQLTLQLILILYATSETKTTSGLDQIFREENPLALGFLIFSTLLSFISCIMYNITGLSAPREYFPIVSQIMAGLYTGFSITKRVSCLVLYFAPSLGLFNLLRHLQAEQTQWDPELRQYFVEDSDGTIQFGNSPKLYWKSIDRWNYTTKYKFTPPDYSFYTYFSLSEYFLIFVGIFFCHGFLIFIVKTILSGPFSRMNFLEKILHSIENMQIPANSEEWDLLKGDSHSHHRRKNSNLKEVSKKIMFYRAFNSINLMPLWILGTDLHSNFTQLIYVLIISKIL